MYRVKAIYVVFKGIIQAAVLQLVGSINCRKCSQFNFFLFSLNILEVPHQQRCTHPKCVNNVQDSIYRLYKFSGPYSFAFAFLSVRFT